jgi:hypothetical protein
VEAVNSEEAVRRCTFWTTNEAETQALGVADDPEVGAFFDGDDYPREQWSKPMGTRNWAIRVSRWITDEDEQGKKHQIENPAYTMIVAEIERRR